MIEKGAEIVEEKRKRRRKGRRRKGLRSGPQDDRTEQSDNLGVYANVRSSPSLLLPQPPALGWAGYGSEHQETVVFERLLVVLAGVLIS